MSAAIDEDASGLARRRHAEPQSMSCYSRLNKESVASAARPMGYGRIDNYTVTELDLNLLYVLVALDERRSVSGAALALHKSQPAVSVALAKLREFFNL